ncbi:MULTISPECIES: hypothetical protein [Bacillaceae]|uniref:hypothetical protein n=1 Tax=Bacillaceae TaxID=186817 RepID=UPI0002D577C3|nr:MULTISPECIES: hypothetical protein [Bacillaceae]EOR21262.1 hypothetical protein A499_23797 [Niallia nealsonii AAU1]SLL37421.1 Uncharacterised protein [Mycobacteroides abscessus subsp. abscessus]HEO8422751.1 hypothetical protein [Yersinia enterocolitica]KAB7670445.1 hypothetical protein F9279_09300 [Bacillus sp. B1-b2]MED3795177.1 hypothetical protein [Niallia alba]
MKFSKIGWSLVTAAATIIIGYGAKKGKIPFISSKIVDLSKVASDTVLNEEKSFGGLKESTLNEIATNTYKGVKAFIDDSELVFKFRSNSNKMILESKFKIDAAGKLVMTFVSGNYGNHPTAPLFFKDNLVEAMNKANRTL